MDLRQVVANLEKKGKKARPPGSVTLPLPLFGGRAFAARFKVLPPEDIAALGEAMGDGNEEDIEANAEAAAVMVSDSCRYVLSREGSKWEPVTGTTGQRVRFDIELAEGLGLELEEQSAAAVVKACWTVEDDETGERMFNQVALGAFGNELLAWMQDTTRPMEGAIVGESQGGPTSSAPVGPPAPALTPASSSPSSTEG